jgi:hypothetical protein
LPGSLFFEPGLVQATIEKSSTIEADSAVLSALLDRDVTQPGSLSISTESFHRPGFRRFVSTRDGQAAFADLFMRLVKPVLRGAFARLPADNAERSKFAYPFFASQVMDGAAFLVSDLRPHRPHDFARVLIFDFGLNAFSRGRLLQACTDIGTFRILALQELLAMRSVNDRLANISASFTQTINSYYDNAHRSLKSNVESISTLRAQMNEIVDQLRGLSGVNRDTIHGVLESAARAQEYVAIVDDRVRALGEALMPGHQTLREFLDRRFKRAVRDIDRAAVRYEMIRRRIDEALGVVRTVLDVREREYQISNQRFSNLLRNIASVGTALGFVGGALYWIWSPTRLDQSISWLPIWLRPFADRYATPETLSLAVVTAGALLLLLMIWYLNRRR